MNVDGLQGGAAAAGAGNGAAGDRTMGKEDFLKLLTTQLTHQDPLNPMEDTEFVAQLAQFSSLEQLIETNKRLEMLAISQSSLTSAAAVDFIGREVEAWSEKIQVRGGVPGKAVINLPQDAEDVSVEIKDAQGNLVRVLNLGSRTAGDIDLDWDGLDKDGKPVPDGEYSINVKALDGEGNDISARVKVREKVTGVTFEKGYAELILGDVKVSMADVVEMY